MPVAVITIALDPVLQLSDTSSVRYETIAVALVLLLGLVVAARIGSMTPAGDPDDPGAGLRVDDLVFISVGAVPGAIVGGRLGYVLDHLDYYRANPSAMLDAAQGGLTLTLAVPLGILTGALVARLLGAPVARWLHASALPLLFVLSAGKVVGILGATGQGAASDLAWATAYAGPGPWASLAADLPAHPSQVYEAIAVAVVIALLLPISRLGMLQRQTGAILLTAVGLWATARFIVAFTWRDTSIAAPLGTDQLLLLGVIAVALVGLVERGLRARPGLPPDSEVAAA